MRQNFLPGVKTLSLDVLNYNVCVGDSLSYPLVQPDVKPDVEQTESEHINLKVTGQVSKYVHQFVLEASGIHQECIHVYRISAQRGSE